MPEDKVTLLINVRMSSGTQANHVVVDTEERADFLRKELERLQQQGKIYGYFIHKVDKQTAAVDFMNWLRSQNIH